MSLITVPSLEKYDRGTRSELAGVIGLHMDIKIQVLKTSEAASNSKAACVFGS